MDNLALYNAVREVPQNAQKPIEAGRLKGKTDINPMWRIKKLTEQFGPCGVGWYPSDVRYWTQDCLETKERAVFCDLNLNVKIGGEWAKPTYGIGGNKVIARDRSGLYLDDDAYKKAYTDALSVACKALGIGADVYWQADSTKYTPRPAEGQKQQDAANAAPSPTTNAMPAPAAKIDRLQSFKNLRQTYGVQNADILATINAAVQDGCLKGIKGDIETMPEKDFARCMAECERRFRAALS